MCKDFLCIFNVYCRNINLHCTDCSGTEECNICTFLYDCPHKNLNKNNEEKKEG